MNKFGNIKIKILQKFTDAYASGNKKEIKDTLKLIKENKEFKELYVFYDEFEKKYFKNKEDAIEYLNEVRDMLMIKMRNVNKFCKELNENLKDVIVNENELYSDLDTFISHRKLKNTDKWVQVKNKLVEHLIKEKEISQEKSTQIIENENLLHFVLVNNFNVLYDNILNEEQKEELKKIINISNDELQKNFETLREEVFTQMKTLVQEEKNEDIKNKINLVLTEMTTMDPTKFNYYKLQQLKNGL